MAAYYSTIKKKEILLLRTKYMDTLGVLLSEIKVKEKDKYCRILLIVGSKNKQQKTPRNRNQIGGCWGVGDRIG